MRLGVIARCDKTGLGYQTRDYYKHLSPVKTLVVDIQHLNGNPQHYEWYPNEIIVKGFPSRMYISSFLKDLDVVLTAESPYNYDLYSMAREMGVKTAVAYNYEFFDWFKYPSYPLPDLLIAPSLWNYHAIDLFAKSHNIKHTYLHHPVDRSEIPFRLRKTNKTLHVAGKPAAHDRNGTWDYAQAVPNGTVITQSDDLAKQLRWKYRQLRVMTNIDNPTKIYDFGDVLVLPRRYGGNCLILNEALSAGMPVIMPDIEPNNKLLPEEWLIPAQVTGTFTPRTSIDIFSVSITDLTEKVNWFKSVDIQKESIKASKIADKISWPSMLPKWNVALKDLL